MQAKVMFDHSKESVTEALGIPEDRISVLVEQAHLMMRKHAKSQIIEAILNSDLTRIEQAFLLFEMGILWEAREQLGEILLRRRCD